MFFMVDTLKHDMDEPAGKIDARKLWISASNGPNEPL